MDGFGNVYVAGWSVADWGDPGVPTRRAYTPPSPSPWDAFAVKFASPAIRVIVPNGGEVWPIGTTQTITWTSVNVPGEVKIELSRDEGANWTTLFDNTPNDGSEAWTATGLPTTKAKIRISSIRSPLVFDISDANFTITTLPPTVVTLPATNITTTGARLNGNLVSLGTASEVKVSFVWGTTLGGPYPNETTPQTRNAPGLFHFDLTGLTPGTTYYFRAKADGGIHGISYGAEKSFTTLTPPPAAPKPPPVRPAALSLGGLSLSATQVPPNYPIMVSVYVTNSGGSPGNITLTLRINGIVEQSQSVTIAAGATSQIIFTVYKAQPGTYIVAVNGLHGSFTVLGKSRPAVSSPGFGVPLIIGIALVFAALFLALLALLRRRGVLIRHLF